MADDAPESVSGWAAPNFTKYFKFNPDEEQTIDITSSPGVSANSIQFISKDDPTVTAPDYYIQYEMAPNAWGAWGIAPCPSPCPMCDAMAAEQTPNEVLYEAIPHLRELADCPCGCNDRTEIWACVIHLNDRAKWTRERIADWLETLDQDLQFKLPESPENTEGNVE